MAPELGRTLKVDEAEHRNDERCRKRCDRKKGKQRCQEQRGHPDAAGGEYAGRWRLRSGIEVDDRTGKATRDGIAPGKGGGDLGGTQTDPYLVRVDPMPLLHGALLGSGEVGRAWRGDRV